jgi:hypothetical protein
MLFGMAGIKGKSGPPGKQNAFRHGLASSAIEFNRHENFQHGLAAVQQAAASR